MITTTELECIKSNVTTAVANEAVRYNNREKRGYDEDFSIQQLMIIDYWLLNNWQQNDDGTNSNFTNFISQDEFDTLIGVVRIYAACAA